MGCCRQTYASNAQLTHTHCLDLSISKVLGLADIRFATTTTKPQPKTRRRSVPSSRPAAKAAKAKSTVTPRGRQATSLFHLRTAATSPTAARTQAKKAVQ